MSKHTSVANYRYLSIIHLVPDGQFTTTSMCPVMGKQHAVPNPGGLCPWIYNHPLGKQLPVSFIGPEPYIKYPPKWPTIGGSEFGVVKILAQKFRFLPKFLPEKSFDIVKTNTTTSGMLYSVRFSSSRWLSTILFHPLV